MTFDFIKLLTLFSFRVFGAFEKLSGAKGFVDTFESFDKSRWSVETDYLLCLEGAHCVYLQSSNFHHLYGKDGKDGRKYFIQLELSNNCREDFGIDKCCEGFWDRQIGRRGFWDRQMGRRGFWRGFCTPFTSANIVSKDKFGYGSFRIYANAAHEVSGLRNAIHEIWSCFYLDTSMGRVGLENTTSISMCMFAGPGPSKEVAIVYQNGNSIDRLSVEIPFDARNVGVIYRIDWSSTFIEWFLNGKSLHKVTSDKFPIPDMPLYWKTGIFPTIDLTREILPGTFLHSNLGNAVVRSNIYRMRYIEESEKEAHDELFVRNESIDEIVPAMKVMILLVVLFICWKLIQSQYKVGSIKTNAYTLMDSENKG